MRHEHDRPARALFAQGTQDNRLVETVEIARRLVEQQEGRVVQKRTCQPQPLPLPAGERIAQLSNRGVIPLRQRADEIMHRRLAAGRLDLVIGRVGARNAQVAANAVVEQMRVLCDKALERAQVCGVDGRNVRI